MAADNLEIHQSLYRVAIRVPADCREAMDGKRWLYQALGTASKTKARRMALPVIAEFKTRIAEARGELPMITQYRRLWTEARRNLSPEAEARYHAFFSRVQPGAPAPTPTMQRTEGSQSRLAAMIDVTPQPASVVRFAAVIENWKDEEKRAPEMIDNVEMFFDKLAEFTGYDDAANPRLADDLIRYKQAMLKAGKSPETVKKYLAMIKTVLKLAKANNKISANPAADLKMPSGKGQSRQDGFSMAEMAKMVTEAPKCKKPVVRIPVLIAAYHGACLAEIVEAHKRDFEDDGEEIIFHIRDTNRLPGQTLKTEFRPRRFPLHSSIIAEVRAYLATIEDGPLFPEIKLDRYGKRAHNAGEHLRKWIRVDMGINRKGQAFHCYRHTAKTLLRRVLPKDSETRNYITGHKDGNGSAADYGRVPIANLREVMGLIPADPLAWQLQ